MIITSFRHKGLRELHETGKSAKVRPDLRKRALKCLDAIEAAHAIEDLATPSLRGHELQGFSPARYAISVSGPWRITFEKDDDKALNVDLEQYH